MLQRLGDVALLGVHPTVLGGHSVEVACQLLGIAPASRQPVGHQGRRDCQQYSGDGDDPRQALEEAAADLGPGDAELKKEVADALETLSSGTPHPKPEHEAFDLWEHYPETADLPLDLLDEDERSELLNHPLPSVRAAAANSFFNQELTPEERRKASFGFPEEERRRWYYTPTNHGGLPLAELNPAQQQHVHRLVASGRPPWLVGV